MVDLTRDQHGRVRARLLDVVPGRSGKAYADWLIERGEAFRTGVKIAALDPFQGYKTAIGDQLEDAVAGWVDWYNNQRLHSTLGNVPAIEYEQHHYATLNREPQPV